MPVAQSSHVNEYNYDAESQTLTVQFVNGAVYSWSGISQTEYDNFHQSGSKGSYVQYKLRSQHGDGTKVQSAPPSTRKRMKYGRDY